jgi:hypothetical protein
MVLLGSLLRGKRRQGCTLAIAALLFSLGVPNGNAFALTVCTGFPGCPSWGSNGVSPTGWLMPSDSVFFTTYITNVSIARFMTGIVNVFAYDLAKNMTFTVGLYVNGMLVDSEARSMTIDVPQARLVRQISVDLADFTLSIIGFSAFDLNIQYPIPAGSAVTVAAATDSPAWVQVDDSAVVHSYELPASAPIHLPGEYGNTGILSPHTISAAIEANGLQSYTSPLPLDFGLFVGMGAIISALAIIALYVATKHRSLSTAQAREAMSGERRSLPRTGKSCC